MNKKKTNPLYRILAFAVALVLVVGVIPFSVNAVDEDVNHVFSVCDNDGSKIVGANVACTFVAADGTSEESYTTGDEGKVEITIPAGTEEVEYTVSMSGYISASGRLTVASMQPSTVIPLETAKPSQATHYEVSASKTGEGSVLLNGSENTITAKIGETIPVDVVVEPATGYLIDSVKINNVEQEVADKSSFSTSLTCTDETKIEVVFTAKLTYTVSVGIGAGGTVQINGEDVPESGELTVSPGEKIILSVEPDDAHSIQHITIKGAAQELGDSRNFSQEYEITENTAIDVQFADRVYTLTATENEHAVVLFDGEAPAGGTKSYPIGTKVEITVQAGRYYQLDTVTIGGEEQTITDFSKFSTAIKVTKDIVVSATCVRYSTVTVSSVGDGTAAVKEVDGEAVLDQDTGTYQIVPGKEFTFIATPDANYRVAKVEVTDSNDETSTEEFTDNNKKYEKTFASGKDYTFKIKFAPNQFKVTADVTTPGSVTISKDTVDYNGETTLTFKPNSGYTVSEFYINGEVAAVDPDSLTYTLKNITEDTTVKVVFVRISAGDMDDVTISKSKRVSKDGKTFIYENGGTATISTTKEGIRVNGTGSSKQNSITLKKDIIIKSIELYYKADGELFKEWHSVDLVGKLLIYFDETKPAGSLTPPARENGYTHYSADFEVKVEVADIESVSEKYSGLQSVEYWIEADGVLTQGKGYVGEDGVAEGGILYNWTEGMDVLLSKKDLTIPVNAARNNSADVKIYLRVTDRAGNVYETTEEEACKVSINTVAPTVEIDVSGEKDAYGTAGYYKNAINGDGAVRIATVAITDRTDTFDADAAKKGFTISAKDKDGTVVTDIVPANMIAAQEPTEGQDPNVHIFTVTFKDDAYYEWDFEYTNKAGLTNEKPTVTGDDPYEFAIDTKTPTGTIGTETTHWNTLFESLTFGLWSKKSITIAATANEENCDIRYYTTTDVESALDADTLKDLFDAGNFEEGPVVLPAEDNHYYVVYARIADKAGNVLFINTDGFIFDTNGCSIDITNVTIPTEYGFYNGKNGENGKVEVQIDVMDNVIEDSIYSGIRRIDYEIYDAVDTAITPEKGTLYSFSYTKAENAIGGEKGTIEVFDKSANPNTTTKTGAVTKADLKDEWTGNIEIDSKKFDSDNIEVKVIVTDNAGNVTPGTKGFPINTTPPTVAIKVDGTPVKEHEGRGYFDAPRTATVTITDRSSTFDKDAATAALRSIITAENYKTPEDYKNGKLTRDTQAEEAVTITWESAGDTHEGTVTFAADANYTFKTADYSYTNKADLKNDTVKLDENNVTPTTFTVDGTAPTAEIEAVGKVWRDIVSALTFAFWTDKEVTASVKDETDATSPLEQVLYYKTDEAMDRDALMGLEEAAFAKEPITVNANERFVVYAKITDFAGNVLYVGTNGIVYDGAESTISFDGTDEPNEYDYYNKDVKVKLQVKDEIEDVYSGIKKISYTISANDGAATEDGVLYSFDYTDNTDTGAVPGASGTLTITDATNGDSTTENVALTADKLRSEWKGEITIDSEKFNYDNVKLTVKVLDNAGNEFSADPSFKINTTPPEVEVAFTDKAVKVDENGRGYFNAARTATVTITDRATTFNEDAATAALYAIISAKSAMKEFSEEEIKEAVKLGEWKTEGDTHECPVLFTADANYTWELDTLAYVNKADVKNNTVTYTEGSVTPTTFTVDATEPTGKVKIAENTWTTFLEKITFGLFSSVKLDIAYAAADETSPVDVSYYINDDPEETLTLEKLSSETEFTPLTQEEKIPSQEASKAFVVYLKVVDYAGNVTYISSDGFIVDDKPSSILLEPKEYYTLIEDTGVYVYGQKSETIRVDVTVKDTPVKQNPPEGEASEGEEPTAATYSGIQHIEYWLTRDDEKSETVVLYDFNYVRNTGENNNGGTLTITDRAGSSTTTGVVPTYDQLLSKWTGTVEIPAAEYNSSNVVFHVRSVDNAGNESTNSVKLDIDITPPEIHIAFDNNEVKNTEYFPETRTATITYTERSNHFSKEDAVDPVDGIKITAVNAEGKPVEDAYIIDIDGWSSIKNAADPDKDTHTVQVTFAQDANYDFSVAYIDEAGNANKPVTYKSGTKAEKEFTVDTTAPTGSIIANSAEGKTWDWKSTDIWDTSIVFGYWSRSSISITKTDDDETSPIDGIWYYLYEATTPSDVGYISAEGIKAETIQWTEYEEFTEVPNKQFVVYLKIVDKAGNTTYLHSGGLIVDDTLPAFENDAPVITITPTNDIYNSDVPVVFTVEDPVSGGTYSGLQSVKYTINDARTGAAQENTETFIEEGQLLPQDQLTQNYSNTVTVSSAVFNSNEITFKVEAIDNAGNAAEEEVTFKIDVTAPVIDISYDNNAAENGTYFNADRTATITVTERNFSADDVDITITNTDGTIPSISGWSESPGSGNMDDTTWTATITYAADGDYTFGIAFTDLAGNVCESISYASSTVAETEFTIDQTLPVIAVAYDNNDVANGNYYKAMRTATLTITEHNFDSSEAVVTVTGVNGEEALAVLPAASAWASAGDTHTATVLFAEDAEYTLDVAFIDMAGNEAADFAVETFFVDNTDPAIVITGVEDLHAYNGNLLPLIAYSDTNIDPDSAVITLTGANRKDVLPDGVYSDIANGRSFAFNDFEHKQEIDDIYTLYVSVTDLAGRTTTQSLRFSVNRFGSTYALSEDTEKLNETYVQNPIDVILTETNATELTNIRITLFKNDKTITLEKDVDYMVTVSGGNGNWYEYTYTIFQSNFAEDGVYRISVYSEDAAGNIAENTLDTKAKVITFGVDKTAPTINIKNVESGETYALENLLVEISANDNLKLVSVAVYLDDDNNTYRTWSGDELAELIAGNNDFTFGISGDSTRARVLRVVAADAANNESEASVDGFWVTTNLWVRYYTNKPLFFTSIGLVVLLSAALVVLITLKRRKAEFEAA